jgi:hypothetical protein
MVLYAGRRVGDVSSFLPPAVDGPKAKYRSCAIVGNAGHLTAHKWGKYIDRHEVVVRFNRQSVVGFTQFVGMRTSARFLNHNDGLGACCRGVLSENRVAGAANNTKPALVLWHRTVRDRLVGLCQVNPTPLNPML